MRRSGAKRGRRRLKESNHDKKYGSGEKEILRTRKERKNERWESIKKNGNNTRYCSWRRE